MNTPVSYSSLFYYLKQAYKKLNIYIATRPVAHGQTLSLMNRDGRGFFAEGLKGNPRQLPTIITMDNYVFDHRPSQLQVFIEGRFLV